MLGTDQCRTSVKREPQPSSDRRSIRPPKRAQWMEHARGRLLSIWQRRGLWGMLCFVLGRIYRHQVSLVFEISLKQPRPPVVWDNNEEVLQFGPENVGTKMTTALEEFLGGPLASDNIEGLRSGDRLFVVASGNEFLHRGYILFRTREKQIIGEVHDTPVIGYCFTSAAARGRGIYRKALTEELNYLHREGYHRAIIVTTADNVASRKGIEAAGFSLAWEASVWIVLNWVVVRCIRTPAANRWSAFVL